MKVSDDVACDLVTLVQYLLAVLILIQDLMHLMARSSR